MVRYGEANRSGDDASENLDYYTHMSQERKYMERHGGSGGEGTRNHWGGSQGRGSRGNCGQVFIVSHEAICKAG